MDSMGREEAERQESEKLPEKHAASEERVGESGGHGGVRPGSVGDRPKVTGPIIPPSLAKKVMSRRAISNTLAELSSKITEALVVIVLPKIHLTPAIERAIVDFNDVAKEVVVGAFRVGEVNGGLRSAVKGRGSSELKS